MTGADWESARRALGYTVEKRWEPAFVGRTRVARQPCRYETYVPDPLLSLDAALPAAVSADVSDAERAILQMDETAARFASLSALAHALLRSEAVGSSKIERFEVGARRLARAEAALAEGRPVQDQTAETIVGNIEAMRLAVDELAQRETLTLNDLLGMHRSLMRHTDRPEIGGLVRAEQTWIGGNDYNPCGAAFVPPPPELVPVLLDDLVSFVNTDRYPPLVQAALAHAQFEAIHPFADGNGEPAGRSSMSCCGGAASRAGTCHRSA